MAPVAAKPVLPAQCFASIRAQPAPQPAAEKVAAEFREEVRAQADSRSTSSGTSTPLSSEVDSEALSLVRRGLDGGLEFGEARVGVKNTFIQLALGRSPSLDGFYEERQTRSCPPSRQQSVDRLLGPADEQQEQPPRTGLLARAGAAAAEVVAPERCSGLGEQDPAAPSSSSSESSAAEGSRSQKQVLILGNVLKQPELGSAELPTVGSAQHRLGGCKPCAFAHTKGCENGVNCAFCHLCQPGERKRRQRQRTARQPEQPRLEAAVAARPPSAQVVASPVLCQPMMSRPVMTMLDGSPVSAASPVTPVTPVVNNWQPANLCMVPVFRFC